MLDAKSRTEMLPANEAALVLFFRLAMAWTFLYAASHQVFDPNFSVAGFLKATKTFRDIYGPLTGPAIAPAITFLVSYGHLLIGLSLLFGFMTRISAACGIVLMMVYWTAHMNFPYIENTNNLLLDYHIVYAAVLGLLMMKHAGHVFGLDGWMENLQIVQQHPRWRVLLA